MLGHKNSEARQCANTNRASMSVTSKELTKCIATAVSTINVPFHGAELYVVNHNGEPYTPMKPIVEGMGMDWASTVYKVKTKIC
ncbi:antirepressor protein Ant [Escherichia coli]|nr:antirepressor protein Ant [Escherichia coli]